MSWKPIDTADIPRFTGFGPGGQLPGSVLKVWVADGDSGFPAYLMVSRMPDGTVYAPAPYGKEGPVTHWDYMDPPPNSS